MATFHEHRSKPIDDVLARLGNPRRSGKGWTGRCPAHDDHSPSLSISVGRGGNVLVFCHAGCSVEEIVNALGLTLTDLFPNVDHRPAMRSPRFTIPATIASRLITSTLFASSWEAARALAPFHPAAQRLQVLRHWDLLSATTDIPAVLALSALIRDVAVSRYCGSNPTPGDVCGTVIRLLATIRPRET
jgi:hypothetical protein